MACQILLHKQRLTKEQMRQLSASGVVAIQTDDPAQFKLVDMELPSFSTNDMVWAFVSAISETEKHSSYGTISKAVIQKLSEIAAEDRLKRKVLQTPVAASEAQ